MPERDKAPLGAPCWVDLMTSDTEKSRAFYSQLFGWTAEEPSEEFGGYFMFTLNGAPMAGGMGSPDPSQPDAWAIYLQTSDTQKAVEATTARGGQVYAPPTEVADLGTMAVLADPTGAAVGAWQPNQFQGFTVLAENATPGWFELMTTDYEKAVEYYREVFGWETSVVSDTDEFRYTTLGEGQQMAAGIMDAKGFLPEGAPSHWSVYFATDDTDATIARATSLGAKVLRPAEDTPYGKLATLADATGAIFKLVGPNEQMPARS